MVPTMAGVLREAGVQKGDVVAVYMPMILAALIGIPAVIHLGAMHTVIFGGFSSASSSTKDQRFATEGNTHGDLRN